MITITNFKNNNFVLNIENLFKRELNYKKIKIDNTLITF